MLSGSMTAFTVQQLVVSVTPEVRESYMSVREQMVASQKTKKTSKKKNRKKKKISEISFQEEERRDTSRATRFGWSAAQTA